MTDPLKLLSIGTHPADVFDQSGGTMAHHASRGDQVACAVLTHGARVHDAIISDSMHHRSAVPDKIEMTSLMKERAKVKAEEIRKACNILGFNDIHFLELDDAVLVVTVESVRTLARLIRKIRPDIVLTHFPKEGDGLTSAHAIGGQIAMQSIQFAGSVDPGDINPPHKVAQVFFFGTGAAATRRSIWDSEGGYYNDIFIDITDKIRFFLRLTHIYMVLNFTSGGGAGEFRIRSMRSRARAADIR